jgi:hypothetical protein
VLGGQQREQRQAAALRPTPGDRTLGTQKRQTAEDEKSVHGRHWEKGGRDATLPRQRGDALTVK